MATNNSSFPWSDVVTPWPTISDLTLALTLTSALLSTGGSAIIIWTFFRFEEIRNTPRKLLLCLTLADVIVVIGNCMGTIRYKILGDSGDFPHILSVCDQEKLCVAISVLLTYASLCALYWTVAISIFFSVAIVAEQRNLARKLVYPFHVVCWCLPGIICIIGLSKEVFGEDLSISAGTWCWIKRCVSPTEKIVWMAVTQTGWEILAYVSMAMLFVILLYQRQIFQRSNHPMTLEEINGDFRKEDLNFVLVPLVFYVLSLSGTIRAFLAVFGDPDDPRFDVFLYLQSIGDNLQGFCNFVVFCILDDTVNRRLFVCFRRQDHNSIQCPDSLKPLVL